MGGWVGGRTDLQEGSDDMGWDGWGGKAQAEEAKEDSGWVGGWVGGRTLRKAATM